MAEFSSALKLTGLDDFITPSQACVKPVIGQKSDGNKLKKAKIMVGEDGSYMETTDDGSVKMLETAKISLNDCLACSGCITSAESVLVTQQSKEEFYSQISKKDRVIVISISPQSRASLAAHYKLDAKKTFKLLTTFFKSIGATYVFDTSFSREFTLLESCAEFVSRYRKEQSVSALPVLASACPGWICYAEKTHGSYILPYISTAKSPQQVMGTVVKDYFAKQLNVTPDKIYHTTIMPCFDKKLEASRDDFFDEKYQTREVDCVLTSAEVRDMINEKNLDFVNMEESPIDRLFTNISEDDHLLGVQGGSGGYLECIFRYAAKELFGVQVGEIVYKTRRNADFKEVTLEVEGKAVLKFAAAYGFRNIQNLVRKIKQTLKSPENLTGYDYVEVMACPSGCVNGGGQIRPQDNESAKDLLRRVEEAYTSGQQVSLPIDKPHPLVSELYSKWVQGTPNSEAAKKILHTQYHEREKLLTTTTMQW